ncbi:unnamed protein product [Rhizophagus irregularis]|uniref:Uncharacterized protein n=1 Tax=Rhizophagus irregularis TaxID=588596 RepID=A0A2I1FSX2_9GLOM|nr:hypothetical protein RhiirA4_512403 [Rhizophagus irregularis]CAB4428864.1 unnamed protein product [Rhizophagus irregularis]
MSEPLSKIKILLDNDPSERFHFVVLDSETPRYMSVKISSAIEHIERGNERNYKSPLRNLYMLFRNDITDTWNLAKETKKFRKYPESFKNISLIWNNLPKNVVEIYEQIYTNYKELIPKFEEFVPYAPQGENEENMDENIVETGAENIEKFVNNSETLVFRSNLPLITKSVEKNEVVSGLVQSSELYTSEMQYNSHDLNSEINTGSDNMRGFPKFFQYSPPKNVNKGEDFEEFINYSEASVFRPEEYQHFTSANYNNSGEKNEVVSDLDSYNNCVPVRPSELYTSEMQYNLHDLNSEIEIEMYLNSLSNTENDNAEGLPTFYQSF